MRYDTEVAKLLPSQAPEIEPTISRIAGPVDLTDKAYTLAGMMPRRAVHDVQADNLEWGMARKIRNEAVMIEPLSLRSSRPERQRSPAPEPEKVKSY